MSRLHDVRLLINIQSLFGLEILVNNARLDMEDVAYHVLVFVLLNFLPRLLCRLVYSVDATSWSSILAIEHAVVVITIQPLLNNTFQVINDTTNLLSLGFCQSTVTQLRF